MIRETKPADIDSVYRVEEESFSRTWSKSSLESELEKETCEFLVFECDGVVAGYIIFWYILDEGEVGHIAVKQACRRKGIAVKLLNECINRHPEVRNIYLEVDKTNAGAICLYRKLGFLTTGEIKDYYGKGVDALRMALSIPKK